MDNKELINIATDISSLLLRYGAEVYRAEQSAKFICNSYDVYDVQVFAIPTSIVMTISTGDDFITKTSRILDGEIDLDMLDKINNLSRYICSEKPSYATAKKLLEEVKNSKTSYNKALQILAYAIVSFGFAIMFGGNFTEGVLAFFIGVVTKISLDALDKHRANNFLKITFSSFIMCFLAISFGYLIDAVKDYQYVLAGALMTLVPGLAITNCMRDFLANDFMSGLAKLAESLVTAIAIALGVAIALFLLV